jgi:putative SOS response-associated peptidase YedK
MCGRIFADYNIQEVRNVLPFAAETNLGSNFHVQSYNITPAQNIVLMTFEHELIQLHWGITFRQFHIINSRFEEFFRKKLFTNMKRCLVPISGYYEWNKDKKPFCFRKNDQMLVLAGLYDEEGVILMTKDANDDVSVVHHRMPVILKTKSQMTEWMSLKLTTEFIDEMLDTKLPTGLSFYRVAPYINDTGNRDKKCITKFEEYSEKIGIKKFFEENLKNTSKEENSLLKQNPINNAKKEDLIEKSKIPEISDNGKEKIIKQDFQPIQVEKNLLKDDNFEKIFNFLDEEPNSEVKKDWKLQDTEAFYQNNLKDIEKNDLPIKLKKTRESKPVESKGITCDLRWFYDAKERGIKKKDHFQNIPREAPNSNSRSSKKKSEQATHKNS